jgi:hypothetical protein
MKTCFTATICRFPDCFIEQINDPTHPCYGLRYQDMGPWIRLDPLDSRSYTYCLKGQVQAIVQELGAPDFWYGYYAWSESDTSMGLPFRSYCHHMAHDLVFDSTGGALLVYTWDWGNRIPLDSEWARYKSVMPRDSSVILEVNNSVIPGVFLNDPDGPFGMFPWSKYMTATTDDQCLPERSSSIVGSWYTWHDVMTLCQLNLPLGFGLDNMIHHVDQRVTDFECNQGFAPDVLTRSINDFLTDYCQRAYGDGPQLPDMLELHKQWAYNRTVTTAQVEQYMIPEWFRLKSGTIFRTDMTEALYYDANDYDKCALLYDKWIYSKQFTVDWAAANIPADAWVEANRAMWQTSMNYPSDMTWENKLSYLSGILPGLLTIHVVDSLGNPVPDHDVFVRRGWLTRIQGQDTFTLRTNSQGDAQVSLKPDVYEVTLPGTSVQTAVLMLHARDKTLNLTLGPIPVAEQPTAAVPARLDFTPNPSATGWALRYALPAPGPVEARLYDAAGALVRRVSQQFPSARGRIRFDAATLSSGVYVLRFASGDFETTRKLVLNR